MDYPTLYNGTCVIVLDLEMNAIFEKFGFYIDPKYTGYNIPEPIWKEIIKEFEEQGFPKTRQLLYQNMLKLTGNVKLNLEVPYDNN